MIDRWNNEEGECVSNHRMDGQMRGERIRGHHVIS